jgi:hypothetical protein
MNVAQKNMELIRAYKFPGTKKSRSGIQDEPIIRKHHRQRLTPIVGVVTSCPQKYEFHFISSTGF